MADGDRLDPALTATLFGIGTGALGAIAQVILSKRLSEQGKKVSTGELAVAVIGASLFNFLLAYWLSREDETVVSASIRKKDSTW